MWFKSCLGWAHGNGARTTKQLAQQDVGEDKNTNFSLERSRASQVNLLTSYVGTALARTSLLATGGPNGTQRPEPHFDPVTKQVGGLGDAIVLGHHGNNVVNLPAHACLHYPSPHQLEHPPGSCACTTTMHVHAPRRGCQCSLQTQQTK